MAGNQGEHNNNKDSIAVLKYYIVTVFPPVHRRIWGISELRHQYSTDVVL